MNILQSKRHIEANDLQLDSINVAPSARDLAYWQATIEFHNERSFSALGGDRVMDERAGKMTMNLFASPSQMRKAWTNAWPEHVESSEAVLHSFDKKYDSEDKVAFRHSLSCWKVKTGLFSTKYVISIRSLFPDGSMPLGFAPAKKLDLSIGRSFLILSGDEVPYRSVRMALADREM